MRDKHSRFRDLEVIVLLILSPALLLSYQVLHIYAVRESWGMSYITFPGIATLALRVVVVTFLPYILVALLSMHGRKVLAWVGYLIFLGAGIWEGFDGVRLRLLGLVEKDETPVRDVLNAMVYETVTRLFGLEMVLILVISLLGAIIGFAGRCKSKRSQACLVIGEYVLILVWLGLFVLFQKASTSVLLASLPAAVAMARLVATDRVWNLKADDAAKG